MAKSITATDIKSTSFYALKLVLNTTDTNLVLEDLQKRIADAGDFYTGEAIVIDISNLDQTPDWTPLIAKLKEHNIFPIGIQTNSKLENNCKNSGLAILEVNNKTGEKPVQSKQATQKNQPEPKQQKANDDKPDSTNQTKKTMVINKPLRSGQSIYAKNSDLVVIGMVSQGAEIIADGNIHVYGPLRGKAIAGASGDTKALILTTQLDPELLAIAGVYRVIETNLPDNLHDQPAKIELQGDTLNFQQLK